MTPIKITLKSLTALALFGLLFSLAVISCKKNENSTPPVDKTALEAKIDTAQNLVDNTTEGTQPGEYVIGSKAPLESALTSAKAVDADASATQTDVNNATAQLSAAITTYRGNLIQPVAGANLIGFWKFNGNANDSSGHNNNGTLTAGASLYGGGTPTLTADRFGVANRAYHFDHGGNVDVPYTSLLNPTQEMSISVWVKKDTAGRVWDPSTYTILSLDRWYGYKFQLQGTNKFFYTVHALNGSDSAFYDRDDDVFQATDGVWYHAVVTFKSGEEDFYINGSLVKTWTDVPGTPLPVPSSIDFVIGQDLPTSVYSTDPNDPHYVNYGGFFTGDIDDVMFYNIALTAAQVQSLYESQKTP